VSQKMPSLQLFRLARACLAWQLLYLPGLGTCASAQELAPHPSPAGFPTDSEATAIRQVLQRQAAAWNEGDLDSFMDHYWRSAHLTFSSGGATVSGWQQTLDRYRSRYSDGKAMGQLTFSNLEITLIGTQAAYVLGNWKLDGTGLPPREGNFTLIFRRIKDQWLIVHDHTSLLSSNE
jgi:ketosteroid isomerase-like protein